jgi:hypothetical protein
VIRSNLRKSSSLRARCVPAGHSNSHENGF